MDLTALYDREAFPDTSRMESTSMNGICVCAYISPQFLMTPGGGGGSFGQGISELNLASEF